MKTTKHCRVCCEVLTDKLPFCDLRPLEIWLPADMQLCFWCRRDLYEFHGSNCELDESQITMWLAHTVGLLAGRVARKLPLRRCEVGDGRGRCRNWAMGERDGLWVCGQHTKPRFAAAPRHYLDWRCQRLHRVGKGNMVVLPPEPREKQPKIKPDGVYSPRGSQNGNARLTEQDIALIRQMISAGAYNTTIARHFGVTHSMISRIRLGKSWNYT